MIRRLLHGSEMRRLSKRCEQQLSDFPVPDPFSLQALISNLEAARNCSIHLVPVRGMMTDLRTACGLRVCVGSKNFILYRPRPTPNQTQHTIFHELAHLWFDHGQDLSAAEEGYLVPIFQGLLAEHLGADVVIQARAHYASVEEREAELSACLIKHLIRRRSALGADLVSVMEASLSHPLAPLRTHRQP
ncbi:ImmA/IrrE family metallo-endopeptidase [Streptantibioticus ferralitis]|uniref:ImmA/IrrE family metallo-endopeptidase n=1 Tax=Streptantibioticus ferralitis TaxID=236510 RepID=A0ABT5Z1L6_9ACTN|nr:ImmA/IrrE family metallo-endopeptidase [Streptantibioticus ferralitis]MDF2257711.1 ImmA/IrrE family metallo-endopeptidase [Streptantibioticus ferralitis]